MKITAEMEIVKLEQESFYGRKCGHIVASTKVAVDQDGQLLELPENQEQTGSVMLWGMPEVIQGWRLGDLVEVTVNKK